MHLPPALGTKIFAGFLIVVGVTILTQAWGYGLGTISNMRSGFAPALLGGALVMLVAAVLVVDRDQPNSIGARDLIPILAVCAGVAVWGLAVSRIGLVPATFALVCIAALGDRGSRVVPSLLTALILSLLGGVLFISLLGLPFRFFVW